MVAQESIDHPLPNTMLAAGVLHMIDNAEKELDQALEHWEAWLPGLVNTTHLLSVKYHRERFVETCVRRDERFKADEQLFLKNMTSIVAWRWGVVKDVLRDVLLCERTLRAAWSPTKFLSGGSIEVQGDDDGGEVQGAQKGPRARLDIQGLSHTLRSAWWWAYAKMLSMLHEIPGEFRSWSEACKCHHWLHEKSTGERSSEAERYIALHAELGLTSDCIGLNCPFKGMRAMELATDEESGSGVQHDLEALSSNRLPSVVGHCAGLPDRDRASVVGLRGWEGGTRDASQDENASLGQVAVEVGWHGALVSWDF